jgi:hypothetical protein
MINYRANKTKTLHAAYRGACRVGYVGHNPRPHVEPWTWELRMLGPAGDHPMGRATTFETAQVALETAFEEWMMHAQLMEKT